MDVMSRALPYALAAVIALQFIVILLLVTQIRPGLRRSPSTRSDVLASPLGITAIAGGHEDFFEVVPAGHALPHTYSETYTTQSETQDRVEVAISQKHDSGVERIASISLRVPPRPPETPQVIVTLRIDAQKRLRVKTTTIETGTVKEYGPFPLE